MNFINNKATKRIFVVGVLVVLGFLNQGTINAQSVPNINPNYAKDSQPIIDGIKSAGEGVLRTGAWVIDNQGATKILQTVTGAPSTEESMEKIGLLTPEPEEIFCFKWSQGISIPGCIAVLSYFILYLSSWVLYVSAVLFDYTLQYTLSMSDIVNSFSAIQYGWEVFRNLINLFFILILVFISISTILQVDSYGYKKLLGKLVIAAILINFSMFFTKVIIDVSNITALVFYKQIMVDSDNRVKVTPKIEGSVAGDVLTSASTAAANYGKNNLSMGIMDALGLQTVWGVAKVTGGSASMGATSTMSVNPAVNSGNNVAIAGGAGNNKALNPWTMTLVGLGGSVFVLILSFIFLAATGMFLLRTVVLIMLLVTSPVAFASSILPQTSSLSSRWWKRLNSAVLFAPVYMLLMFVTLKMVWGRGDQITDLLSILSNSSSSSMNSIFFFFLLCAMLVMCLTAAASIGAVGSKTMSGWGKTLGTKAKNYAYSRSFTPVSWAADKASKNRILSRIPGIDKLADAKVGGSSYRSRVADKEKFYQGRGEFIKKNVTGTLIRRVGETDKDFGTRKKNAETAGEDAQKAYLGIKKNAQGEEVRGAGFWAQGRNVAANKLLETASKKANDAGTKKIARSQENLSGVLNGGIEAVLVDLVGSGHLRDVDVNDVRTYLQNSVNFKKDTDSGLIDKKEIKVDKIYELVNELKKPLATVSEELSQIELEIDTNAKIIRNPPIPNATTLQIQQLQQRKQEAMNRIAAAQARSTIATRKKSDLAGLITQMTNEAKSIEDVNIQNKLSGAIEDSKPKP